MAEYMMGIDIGTSSVKVSVVDPCTNEIVEHHIKATNCEIPVNIEGAHEQSVPTILAALNVCVSKLSCCTRSKITKIGVCGQMHGVMLWKVDGNEKPWMFHDKSYRLNESKIGRLYTWQDGRCDQSFLATLPQPDSHLGISTGFGIPTLFWLKKNNPDYLKKYNRSGLISSFVVAMLCDQEQVYTSYQNAASWGYYSCKDHQWNLKLLDKANFPVELLPKLKPSGEMAGTLANTWFDIPEGVPVGVDLGDLQCTMISTLDTERDAVFNLSTSCQIAFLVNNYEPPVGPPTVFPYSYWPYFDNQYVVVAASLNGGNILTFFVNMLQGWVEDMGECMDKNKTWAKLIQLGLADSTKSNVEFKPTCLGERCNPEATGSVSKLTGTNLSLGHVFKKICEGLVENVASMLPRKLLQDAKIERFVGNGTGLHKNPILINEIEKVYGLRVEFGQIGDASKGAALAVYRYLRESYDRHSTCCNK